MTTHPLSSTAQKWQYCILYTVVLVLYFSHPCTPSTIPGSLLLATPVERTNFNQCFNQQATTSLQPTSEVGLS